MYKRICLNYMVLKQPFLFNVNHRSLQKRENTALLFSNIFKINLTYDNILVIDFSYLKAFFKTFSIKSGSRIISLFFFLQALKDVDRFKNEI